MIVQCPNCQSKSRVDDAGAARGARVRCASCAHVFLPTPAVVAPKVATQPAQAQSSSQPSFEEEFGGKTSLFTGVVPRELVGLSAAAPPPPAATPAKAPPKAVATEATFVGAQPRATPAPVAPAAESDEGFGGNRTQAIDVSQLAAFAAKMPTAKEPAPAPQSGLGTPAARPKTSAPTSAQAPAKLAALVEPPAAREDPNTAVIGTHEPGLLSAGVTLASRVVGGVSLVAGLCGLIFYASGNAVYAACGLMGGQSIDIQDACTPEACVEQVTSTLYTLASGREALVALGTVGNPGDTQGPRLEVVFRLTDASGKLVAQARGPIGAVLSLEELATLSLPDSAAAELRRRVEPLALLAPHSHDRKFMAVLFKDPQHAIGALSQSVTLAPALPSEPAPAPSPIVGANTAVEAPPAEDPITDPELPQSVVPAANQALSNMPPSQAPAEAPAITGAGRTAKEAGMAGKAHKKPAARTRRHR